MTEKKVEQIAIIDPPSGWRYGFPKRFDLTPGESVSDWFERNGYPKHMIELALKYSRMWYE